MNYATQGLTTSQILVYPPGSTGSATPARTITPPYGFDGFVSSMTTDPAGSLYLGQAGETLIYGPSVNGVINPTRYILTLADDTSSLAVDSSGDIYQGERSDFHEIHVYSPNGPISFPTPINTITDYYDSTGSATAVGLAFDTAGSLYATYQNTDSPNSIQIYGPGASGNAEPTRTISGSATTLQNPTGISVDSAGFIYVVDYTNTSFINPAQDPVIKIFSPGASGNTAPAYTITSAQWTGPGQAAIAIH